MKLNPILTRLRKGTPLQFSIVEEDYSRAKEKHIDVFDDHFFETLQVDGKHRLELDYDIIEQMKQGGNFRLYVARDITDSKIVGYATVFLIPNIFFKGTKFADVFAIYTLPEFRGKGVFTSLVKHIETSLHNKVQYIQIGMKDYPEIILKKGYKFLDAYYYKKIS